MTGSAAREGIVDVPGHFRSESFGRLSPALERLERDGSVEQRAGGSTGGSTYALRPPGLRRLRTLLAEPIRDVPPRNGLMPRPFFGRQLVAVACRRLGIANRRGAEEKLGRVDEAQADLAATDPRPLDQAAERP